MLTPKKYFFNLNKKNKFKQKTQFKQHEKCAVRCGKVLPKNSGPRPSKYAISDFVYKLGLPKGQIRRDYLEGGSCWKLGAGRGRKLNNPQDWRNLHGKRGGGQGTGKPHVRVGVMKELFQKCHSNRHLRL